jgi:hypothetical protein
LNSWRDLAKVVDQGWEPTAVLSLVMVRTHLDGDRARAWIADRVDELNSEPSPGVTIDLRNRMDDLATWAKREVLTP